MDLGSLYRAAGRRAPGEAAPAPRDDAVPRSAAPVSSVDAPKAEDLHGFVEDELRRAAYPDEWAEIEGNSAALEQFAASLRATGLWAESCALTAAEWALPEPDEEPSPGRPLTCSDCRFWTADRINPASGLGACNAPLPEHERLRRCPTPWPRQAGCSHGRAVSSQVVSDGSLT